MTALKYAARQRRLQVCSLLPTLPVFFLAGLFFLRHNPSIHPVESLFCAMHLLVGLMGTLVVALMMTRSLSCSVAMALVVVRVDLVVCMATQNVARVKKMLGWGKANAHQRIGSTVSRCSGARSARGRAAARPEGPAGRGAAAARRARGGGDAAAPAQGEDIDLLMQHFNHTGQIDHIDLNPEHLTAHVIAPTVRNIVQTQFPHAEGHQLTDLLRKRGHAVPASLQEAKAQLQKFADTARGVRAGWHQGVYSTVETMVSTTHNPSLIMELFACIATVMDSYSQLSAEDTGLVLPALLTCAAMLQPAAAERAAARWREQPYAPQHIAEVDQLRAQIKAIRQSQTTAVRGGGASRSPVDISRHLLALNATMAQKQERVDTYDKIAAGAAPPGGVGSAAAAAGPGGSAPPTSLSSSILQGASPAPAPAPSPPRPHRRRRRSRSRPPRPRSSPRSAPPPRPPPGPWRRRCSS